MQDCFLRNVSKKISTLTTCGLRCMRAMERGSFCDPAIGCGEKNGRFTRCKRCREEKSHPLRTDSQLAQRLGAGVRAMNASL